MLRALVFSALLAAPARQAAAAPQPRTGPSADFSHGDLKAAPNHRFLIHADGTPFFYLGDTSWELFHRLSREDAESYLEKRRAQGFTVIQAVVLAEFDGLHGPNFYGDRPLTGDDPSQPNEAYFRHVDFIVRAAAAKGLYIGMLPTWGDKVTGESGGTGPVVFTPENALTYGRFLGARYKDSANLIWILGGDRGAADPRVQEIWRQMARGLREGDGGRHLFTFHPRGNRSSSEWFHRDAWLDFNMLQSGHSAKNIENDKKIDHDYALDPAKPALDGEPRYEDHPVNWKPANGWFDDADVRQGAYWALFAGAHGHTYGCHDIWQFLSPAHPPVSSGRTPWQQAIDFPGAWQMGYARELMESRPMLERVPDQSLLAGAAESGPAHPRATRGRNYAFVYLPEGGDVTVRMGRISGVKVAASWFEPRSGAWTRQGEFANSGTQRFTAPSSGRGNDWVLVLDDAARKTTISIDGDRFRINGRPTYEGRSFRGMKIEGLLLNSRMVQGIFDDANPQTRSRWAYPDTGQWDADRNTREFIAAMPEWRAHGLLAFTINLQGGSPEGYSKDQPWDNTAFTGDGSLKPDYMARLERILDRADQLGMAAIVGYFYFGQDQRLRDEEAVKNATRNATQWIRGHGYTNILVDVVNETNVKAYDHAILMPERVDELIRLVRGMGLLAGTSYGGGAVPRENVARASDFLVMHGNGVKDPKRIAQMAEQARAVPGYRPMPVLFNEDDHFEFDQPANNFLSALSRYASWGYFDPGANDYREGYQCPPVNWRWDATDRKRQFFELLREVTGTW
jgi:hypothetical protein